jgi:hypothetical protein
MAAAGDRLERQVAAIASTQGGGGMSGGSTSYAGDDISGVAQANLVVAAAQLTLTRANTSAAADIAWFVIEFDIGCARAKSVQQGTFTNTTNGTTTIAVSSVDTTKAFLLYSLRSNSNRPVGSALKGRLATATALEFSRATDEAGPSPIDVQWTLVEYTCGVRVQRGSATADTNVNVAITPVVSLNQAFVTCSKSTDSNTTTSWDNNDALLCDLTSTGNLQVRMGTGSSDGSSLWWQVVEFTSSEFINVQKGSTSLTGATLSTNVTLSSAVDPTRSFVLVGMNTPSAGNDPDIGARTVRARLVNSTTLTIDRSIFGNADDLSELLWQVVELKDATVVQAGSASFAAGVATATATLTWVRTAKTVAFASTQGAGGQESGRTSYNGDDIPGAAQATLGPHLAHAADADQGQHRRSRHRLVRRRIPEPVMPFPIRTTSAKIAAALIMLLVLGALTTSTTLARFSDQDTVGSNAFTASTINLTLTPSSAVISYAGMLPGDSVTNSLVVANAAGSSALRYAISASATNTDTLGLKEQLVLTVRTSDVTTPASPCNDFDGTQLYAGDLDSTAGKIVGDSTQGAQTGDRSLTTSASETLCFRAFLPSSTGNSFKNATTTATFTFDAEQTANN